MFNVWFHIRVVSEQQPNSRVPGLVPRPRLRPGVDAGEDIVVGVCREKRGIWFHPKLFLCGSITKKKKRLHKSSRTVWWRRFLINCYRYSFNTDLLWKTNKLCKWTQQLDCIATAQPLTQTNKANILFYSVFCLRKSKFISTSPTGVKCR